MLAIPAGVLDTAFTILRAAPNMLLDLCPSRLVSQDLVVVSRVQFIVVMVTEIIAVLVAVPVPMVIGAVVPMPVTVPVRMVVGAMVPMPVTVPVAVARPEVQEMPGCTSGWNSLSGI